MKGERSNARLQCFPYVQNTDNFIYGDGTVYYAARFEVPHYLNADNPNIKAIFVIRDPIERSRSHHRFSYKNFKSLGLQDMNEMVDIALDESNPQNGLLLLHSLAVEAVKFPPSSPEVCTHIYIRYIYMQV